MGVIGVSASTRLNLDFWPPSGVGGGERQNGNIFSYLHPSADDLWRGVETETWFVCNNPEDLWRCSRSGGWVILHLFPLFINRAEVRITWLSQSNTGNKCGWTDWNMRLIRGMIPLRLVVERNMSRWPSTRDSCYVFQWGVCLQWPSCV